MSPDAVERTHVVGLDPSLTSFGVAHVELCSDGSWGASTFELTTSAGGFARLDYLIERVVERALVADLVVIEGPSYRSPSNGQVGHHARAGLWWLLAFRLWFEGVHTAVVPPAVRAKYATGKGNASKGDVLQAVRSTYPDVVVRTHDAADALALAALGARHLGHPIDDLPAAQELLTASVTWPASTNRFPLPVRGNRP